MKFLLIANNDYDGVGQHVVNLRNALDKKGHFSEIMLLSSLSSEKKNKIFAKRSFFLRALFFFFEARICVKEVHERKATKKKAETHDNWDIRSDLCMRGLLKKRSSALGSVCMQNSWPCAHRPYSQQDREFSVMGRAACQPVSGGQRIPRAPPRRVHPQALLAAALSHCSDFLPP